MSSITLADRNRPSFIRVRQVAARNCTYRIQAYEENAYLHGEKVYV